MFRKATTLNPLHSAALVALGNLLLDGKIYPLFLDNIMLPTEAEQAAALYRRARVLNPYYPDAILGLADLILRKKIAAVPEDFGEMAMPATAVEQAKNLYLTVMEHEPGSWAALLAYGKLQEKKAAIYYYRAALKLNFLCHEARMFLYDAIEAGLTAAQAADFGEHSMPASRVEQKVFFLRAALQDNSYYLPALTKLALLIESEEVEAEESDFQACPDKSLPENPPEQAAKLYRLILSKKEKHEIAMGQLAELVINKKIQHLSSDLPLPYKANTNISRYNYLLTMYSNLLVINTNSVIANAGLEKLDKALLNPAPKRKLEEKPYAVTRVAETKQTQGFFNREEQQRKKPKSDNTPQPSVPSTAPTLSQ